MSLDIFTVIEYIAVLLVGIYSVGLLLAWIYEIRKNALYLKMQKSLNILKDMHLSAALEYAKAYKIRHDYRRSVEPLERVQKFLLVQVLFVARSENKTGKGWL